MKRILPFIALAALVLSLLYDIVLWGAVPRLPDVGADIVASAHREAPLASAYIALGNPLDAALPSLQAFGQTRLVAAWSDGFERIRNDSTVAMDLLFSSNWNATHRWIKTMFWLPPVLLLATIVLFARRPKRVVTLGSRR